MIAGFLEPNVIPGLDRAVLEILITLGAIACAILVLMIASIVGVIRANRRRRRREHSRSAIGLAIVATTVSTTWLLYWTAENIYHRHNPFDGLLAINLVLCVLPFWWLLAALRARASATR
jgi:undecaprenyl pyrophosphate phosphatase UppP